MASTREPPRQEAPFDFFRLRTLSLAPRMGVDPAVAAEAVAIMATVFGEEWLNQAADDFSPNEALPFRRHPIGDLISTAGDTQLADVLELVQYLKLVASAPGLPDIIAGLKGYYYSALLQLSKGARLALVGARDLAFEPPAKANRASDVHCMINGDALQVECYRTSGSGPRSDEHVRLAFHVLEDLSSTGHVLSIAVALHVPLTAAIRQEIRAVIAEAVADVVRRITPNERGFPGVLLTHEIGAVSVMRSVPVKSGTPPMVIRPDEFPHQGEDFSVCVRSSVAPRAMLTHVEGADQASLGRSVVAIWLADDERSEHVDPKLVARLGRKIEAKLVQTRTDHAAARLLVVQTPLTSALTSDAIGRLKGKIVNAHDDVLGLLLVDRNWRPDLGRHGYDVVPVLRDDVPPAIRATITALGTLDER